MLPKRRAARCAVPAVLSFARQFFWGYPQAESAGEAPGWNVSGSCDSSCMNDLLDTIGDATVALRSVARASFVDIDGDVLCGIVAKLAGAKRLLDAAAAVAAAELDRQSAFDLGPTGLAYRHGQRNGVALVEELTRSSRREAASQIRLGTAISPRISLTGEVLAPVRPAIAEAMLAGAIDADAAAILARCLEQAERGHPTTEQVDAAERSLVEFAETASADLVAIQARVWREALDPDGAEPREEAIRERRGATLSRERNGISRLIVDCDPTLAAHLRSAFGAAGAPGREPVFLSEHERDANANSATAPTGEAVEEFVDPRSRAQINHDVILGLVTAGMRSTGRAAGELRATVTVMATVRLEDLLDGTGHGWMDGIDEPVSVETIRQFSCDAGYQTVVLGAHDEPLFLGRSQRFFTRAQKRALAVRDGGCVWPQCQAPPGWCDAHHVREFSADSGPTDIDNGVLLCPAHHHMLHHSDYTVRMIGGRPHLKAPPSIDPDHNWRPLGRSRVLMNART
jgi:hypothetical protein